MALGLVREELSHFSIRYTLENIAYPGCGAFQTTKEDYIPASLRSNFQYLGTLLLAGRIAQSFGVIFADSWKLIIETTMVGENEIGFANRLEMIAMQLAPQWKPQPIPRFIPQEYTRVYNALAVIASL